jgi:replicative DNA helicase
MLDKPPSNINAEESVIGSILVNPEIINKISLAPEDFSIIKNGLIFKALKELYREKITIDQVTVVAKLESNNQLEMIGGAQELMRLVNNTPSSLHGEAYAAVVLDASRRRSIIQTASKLATAAYDLNSPIDTAISEGISNLANKANIKNGAVHIGEYVSRLYDIVDKRYQNPVKKGGVSGIPTGFYDFDAVTDGFHQGEETILSAEPGLGKSLLAFQMAYNMSKVSPGAIYEIEMSGLAVSKRQISGESKIPTRDMNRGNIEDWNSFIAAVEKLSTADIYMSDDTRLTTATLRADLARLREEYNIKWFVLDYLRLLKDRYGKDETERTAWLSAEVHDICKDLNLAGLVIHSMNKAGVRENSGNQADLSGSVQVLYDADQIIFMLRQEKYENLVTLKWAKFREGELPSKGITLSKLDGFPAFKNYVRP